MLPFPSIDRLIRSLCVAAICAVLAACGATSPTQPPSSKRPASAPEQRLSRAASEIVSRRTAPLRHAAPEDATIESSAARSALPAASAASPLSPRRPVVLSPRVSKPLIASPERYGILEVRLHPVENIVAGSSQLITFGVPFPRGSITAAGLTTVRVLDRNGAEIPAFVEALTPWRHLNDPQLDGASVRIARIQIRYSLAVAYPNFETVRVEWGFTPRAQSRPALEATRDGWQPVVSGSFVAADGVSEPKVYALLQAATLSKGMLKLAPMTTFVDAIGAMRDDPAVMDATEHYPEFQEQMYAAKNFFYAHINEDDPRVTVANLTPYKSAEGEPWLYDRVSTFYALYFRSGSFKALRESVRAAEYYRLNLYPIGTVPDSAVGAFKLKNPNPGAYIGANGAMYSYSEGLAYTHWLTGDDLAKDAARLAAKAHEDANDEPDRWSPTSSYTERHIGIKLMAHVVAYELFGDAPYKTGATRTFRERVQTIADNLIWHQNGAGGALPANRVDGGLWKYGSQEGNGPAGSLLVSFWQTPFVIEPMVRVYALSDRADVAHFIRRSGNALKFAGKSYSQAQRNYRTDVPENLGLVDYVTLIDGSTYAADGVGAEHALSVAGALAWSHYFSRVTNQRDDSLKQAALDLYRTYDYEVNEWTRPAAPASGLSAYRNSPWRRYNWTYKTSGHLAWCLSEVRSISD
jgi:hypothetical protein